MKNDSIYVSNQPLAETRKIWHQALARAAVFSNPEKSASPSMTSLGKVTAAPVYARTHPHPITPRPWTASPSDSKISVPPVNVHRQLSARKVYAGQYRQQRSTARINAVVMIEDVFTMENGAIELISPATPWQHVRTVGEDIVATELIVPEGHEIRPIDQGAMLAAGVIESRGRSQSPVLPLSPPESELIEPGNEVEPGPDHRVQLTRSVRLFEPMGCRSNRSSSGRRRPGTTLLKPFCPPQPEFRSGFYQRRSIGRNKGFFNHRARCHRPRGCSRRCHKTR